VLAIVASRLSDWKRSCPGCLAARLQPHYYHHS
jgi:hypothetical protein